MAVYKTNNIRDLVLLLVLVALIVLNARQCTTALTIKTETDRFANDIYTHWYHRTSASMSDHDLHHQLKRSGEEQMWFET